MGIGGSSPLNEQRKQQIKRIAEDVLGTFSKNYLAAMKELCLKHAKEERKKALKQQEKEIKLAKKLSKHRRPRDEDDNEPIVEKLEVKIHTWETLDSDVDPYVVCIYH